MDNLQTNGHVGNRSRPMDSPVPNLPGLSKSPLDEDIGMQKKYPFASDLSSILRTYCEPGSNISAQDTMTKISIAFSAALVNDTNEEAALAIFWSLMFEYVSTMQYHNEVAMKRWMNLVLELKKRWPTLPKMSEVLHDHWEHLYLDPNNGLYLDHLHSKASQERRHHYDKDGSIHIEDTRRWTNFNALIATLTKKGLLARPSYILTPLEKALRTEKNDERTKLNIQHWLPSTLNYFIIASPVIYTWCLNGRDPEKSIVGFDLDRWDKWQGMFNKLIAGLADDKHNKFSDMMKIAVVNMRDTERKADARERREARAVQASYHLGRGDTWRVRDMDENGILSSAVAGNEDMADNLGLLNLLRNSLA